MSQVVFIYNFSQVLKNHASLGYMGVPLFL